MGTPAAISELRRVGPGKPWRKLMDWQIRLTQWMDQMLPCSFRVDGNLEFLSRLVPEFLRYGQVVYDVGGGKNPVIGYKWKSELGLRTIGLDLDARELAAAPGGVYDREICADITKYSGAGDADLVLCQALLEHVPDTGRALAGIASMLKPDGIALIFVPCRNAVFARLNLALPRALKQKLLGAIFPETCRDHGFPAYYHLCTPAEMELEGRRHGLIAERRWHYYASDYFRWCLPIHLVWRLWLLLFRAFAGAQASETFTLAFRKGSGEEL